MLELREDTLVVFVSDSHIGGDAGCDGFESPEELGALFTELSERDGPVELILAGDFFDFLQIGSVSDVDNRASLTISRPEYTEMFEALRRFKSSAGKRVIYLPGNHDAESFWNPKIQETLRERGLVDEFAYSYLACMKLEGEQRIIYCEHGNQFDPENTVEDYGDRLDTPLGHHIVTDFTRRIAPFGEVSPGLDLSEIKMVYPLMAIPQWISSRYFYNLVGKATAYLLLPLLASYVLYRAAAYVLSVAEGNPLRFLQSYQELPRIQELFTEIAGFALLVLLIFAIFFIVVRRAVRRTLTTAGGGRNLHYSPAQVSRQKIHAVLDGKSRLPMNPFPRPTDIDVFVSGHTHLPSLTELKRPHGGKQVMVNSGCWLRQLQPIKPHLNGPPVFVSKFVLTHVRVFARDSGLCVELWEHPKPAEQRLTRLERLLSWNRRPPQPPAGSKPHPLVASSV